MSTQPQWGNLKQLKPLPLLTSDIRFRAQIQIETDIIKQLTLEYLNKEEAENTQQLYYPGYSDIFCWEGTHITFNNK